MSDFVLPSNAVRLATPNPYLLLRNLGLERLKSLVLPKFVGQNIYNAPNDFKTRGEKFDADVAQPAPTAKKSYLGTPIMDFIEFKYKQKNPLFLETVLYDVSLQKNIVKTEIQGRKGTVKEYISEGDYQISIKGSICSSNAREYPTDQVAALMEYLRIGDVIQINSRLLNNIFGIYDVVIENFAFPQTAGFFNMQNFEIHCVDDTPIEVQIKNNQNVSS